IPLFSLEKAPKKKRKEEDTYIAKLPVFKPLKVSLSSSFPSPPITLSSEKSHLTGYELLWEI
ncbi:MAG: hypothetical protein NC416_18685, partial [Eubacterium sp.]|nr:hypothetical protein [Eubacterium sp.]